MEDVYLTMDLDVFGLYYAVSSRPKVAHVITNNCIRRLGQYITYLCRLSIKSRSLAIIHALSLQNISTCAL